MKQTAQPVQPLSILLVAALILPAVVFGVLMWRSYEMTLSAAEAQVMTTVRVLREHAQRVFEAQQLIIEQVDQAVAGMTWDEIANSEDAHRRLAANAAGSEHVDGLFLVDAKGHGVNSAEFFPMLTTVHDRDYYRELKDADILHFGSVIVGKIKGNLNFNLSRRRGSPSSEFDGFDTFYRNARLLHAPRPA